MSSARLDLHVEGLPHFWRRVRGASRRFLALDYDGTLAPFRIQRMKAKPLPDTLPLITRISESGTTRLAILSGRPVVELERLLGGLRVEMVGSHGFEIRDPRGQVNRMTPDQYQSEGLERAYASVREQGLLRRIERKSSSVAYHVRGTLDGADQSEWIKCLWTPISIQYGLEIRDFNGGVELRATGVNKGTALLELIRSESRDALIVYLGDDETDEDAFEVIRGKGIGIKVGGYGSRTAASGRIANCDAVRAFLRTWHSVTRPL